MKCLVTGGAGFIGSHLIPKLIGEGHKVVSIDNYSTGKKENEVDGCQYFDVDIKKSQVKIISSVKAEYKTGGEMEALTAVMCAGLTIYDMCKSVDKLITIKEVKLIRKSGGKSGDFVFE